MYRQMILWRRWMQPNEDATAHDGRHSAEELAAFGRVLQQMRSTDGAA